MAISSSTGTGDQNNVYEIIAARGHVASVTNGSVSATRSGSGSVVAANPQYGELGATTEPQPSIADNPQYGEFTREIPRVNSISNTYVNPMCAAGHL